MGIFCVSIMLIVAGAFFITAKDELWELTRRQHAAKGLAAERTEEWEDSTTRGGYLFVVVGIAGTIAAFLV